MNRKRNASIAVVSIYLAAILYIILPGYIENFLAINRLVCKYRKYQIKKVMTEAWSTYKKYAWGCDYLGPLLLNGINEFNLGLTIIDSLDTLIMMDMMDEYRDAVEWISTSLKLDSNVSFFETTIRVIGGLVSSYEQTHDYVLIKTAEEVADKLLKAFNTRTGFPCSIIHLKTGECTDHSFMPNETLLADAGSFQLEFLALSESSGKNKYWKKAYEVLRDLIRLGSLPPAQFSHVIYSLFTNKLTIDSMGDSYFEYLLKLNLYDPINASITAGKFYKSMVAATDVLLKKSINGFYYMSTVSLTNVSHVVSHLSFFLPAALYLAYRENPDIPFYLELGNDLKNTAERMYDLMKDGFAPEEFYVSYMPKQDIVVIDGRYKLRPEFIETLFYDWRVNKNLSSRIRAWKLFKSIKKNCYVNGAYTTVKLIDQNTIELQNKMDSYFLSETLKYLYLIFSEDSFYSLDDYVFNTQAHPFKKRYRSRKPDSFNATNN